MTTSGKKRQLANILGKKKAIRLLLMFLKITRVVKREKTREKKLEQKQKNDQKDKNPLK